ncbi:MAG TPA: hypothetical protein VGP07_20695 [Polyangia bacterium]|jgi:hypothetical protein
MKPHAIDPFPRNRLGLVRSYVGKKITAATTDFHYVVGRLLSVQDDDVLVIEVGRQLVKLPRHNLATIQEADAALAEYVK